MITFLRVTILNTVLMFTSLFASTQDYKEDFIHQQILKNDSLLFEYGFNRCLIDSMENIIAEDVVFYHDQSGILRGKEKFLNSIHNNICGLKDYKAERKLRSKSTEIHLLLDQGELYGAVQKGDHEFYATEAAKAPYLTSTASFTHLWIRKNNKWMLKEVLSYNHRLPTEEEKDSVKIHGLMQKYNIPNLGLGLIKDGKIIKTKTYTLLSEQSSSLMHFNVASLTKPIVSMLTLKLIENNAWQLNEPIYTYWTDPDVQNDPFHKELTTKHILSHQSGFKNWRFLEESGKLRFNFKPGTQMNYSGEGFEYLQKALENKFGKSLQQLADSLLFQPLTMNHTSFLWNDQLEENTIAAWYHSDGKTIYPFDKNKTASAADNLLTTISDYCKFGLYTMHKIDSEKTLYQDMIQPQNHEEDATHIGLGWEIIEGSSKEDLAILHTGGDKGVNTLIILNPYKKEGLVVFTNSDNGKSIFFDLIKANLSNANTIIGAAN